MNKKQFFKMKKDYEKASFLIECELDNVINSLSYDRQRDKILSNGETLIRQESFLRSAIANLVSLRDQIVDDTIEISMKWQNELKITFPEVAE